MGLVEVEGMEFYSFHGHYEAEQLVGNRFLVNLAMEGDCSKASKTDELEDALDYHSAYLIVKKEMETPSKLLENVAQRILDALKGRFQDKLVHARVKISKLAPPMGGRIEKVSITLSI